MGFTFKEGRFYLMPVMFGPASTPRATIDGQKCYVANPQGTQYNHYRVVYETNADKLENILPKGFSLNGPYVVVSFSAIRNVAFMAGRGYEIVSIEIPVHFKGEKDEVTGFFEPVLWENHGDNCIIGREQTGFNKIFGDIQTPIETAGIIRGSVGTWGFKFMEMTLDITRESESLDELNSILFNQNNEGRLHYKYIPRTGEPWTEADADYITFSPSKWNHPTDYDISKLPRPAIQTCKGEVTWYRPEWREAPTQSHIIQYLHDLEIKRYVGAVKHTLNSANDLRNQRILR